MPTSEDQAIAKSLQTSSCLGKLSDLGLRATDLYGTVVNLGAGNSSTFQQELLREGVHVDLIEVDAKPRSDTSIRQGKFSRIPVDDNRADLLLSRNAMPMYLPPDNPELAIQSMAEVKRVLKLGGEARFTPWLSSFANAPNGAVISDQVKSGDRPAIFQAMRSVPGLTFTLIQEGEVDPTTGMPRRGFTEVMIVRKVK